MESRVWILLVVLAAAAFTAYAATSENNDLSTSLTVNAFVDTSIDKATLTFGSLDPGTTDNAASNNPVTLTNTANSNTAVDIYMNNSNMTYSSYFINATNLSVWTANSAAVSVNFTGYTYLNGSSANQGFYENLAVSTGQAFYFWHDVPAGQTAGAYTSTVRIHSVADGQAP